MPEKPIPAAPEHALDRLWAGRPSKLLAEEFDAGNTLRVLWAKAALASPASVDSTRRERVDGVRSSREDEQLAAMQAKLALERIKAHLSADNWRICEKFLRDDSGVAEAVMAVIPCHPDGTLYRLREALMRAREAIEKSMGRSARS